MEPHRDAATQRVNGAPFGWIANKDVGDKVFTSAGALQLPQVSHGLNSYKHLDTVVFFVSTPAFARPFLVP